MGRIVWKWVGIVLLLMASFGEERVFAISSIPLDGALSNISAFLSTEVASVVVKVFGLVFDHRSYEPATPLGTKIGLDLGVEVDLVQIPSDLTSNLSNQGINMGTIPVLPSLKELNFHKGMSDSVDFGGSILSFQGYFVWALELKIALSVPEEGPSWAIRLSRNSTHIPVGNTSVLGTDLGVAVDTVTWTPELVMSKKLDFADPYLAVGYQYATGAINVTSSAGTLPGGLNSISGSGGGFLALIGLSLKPPNVGLRLTLEGAYSSAGFNSLGTKVGFSF